jgi:hypothetical protein
MAFRQPETAPRQAIGERAGAHDDRLHAPGLQAHPPGTDPDDRFGFARKGEDPIADLQRFDRPLPLGRRDKGAGQETDEIARRARYGLAVAIGLIGQNLIRSANIKNKIAVGVCSVVRAGKAGPVAVRVAEGVAGCQGAVECDGKRRDVVVRGVDRIIPSAVIGERVQIGENNSIRHIPLLKPRTKIREASASKNHDNGRTR